MTLEQKKEECLALLRSTKRPKIESLINHITKMGFFKAPGSLRHHRFEGGLLSHSLETYHKAMMLREKKIKNGLSPDMIPVESVIIAALMHDLCKAVYYVSTKKNVLLLLLKVLVVIVHVPSGRSVIRGSC